jgi:DNA polymerase III subunit delta
VADVVLMPVYLITGSDRPKVATALSRLRRHFEAEAVERVSALEAPAADAVALCNAGSLFGDGRLVIVDDIDGRPSVERRLSGGWKAADTAALEEYLAAPAPGTVLALIGHEVKRSSALGKVCARAGEILDYSLAKKSLPNWVAERFAQHGVRAEADACAALVHLVGEDLDALASEVEKVVTWAAGEPVGEREIEELVPATADTPTFALTDAWANRDSAAALTASEAILDRESRPRRDTVPRLAAALAAHAARMRRLKRLAAEGVRPREAAGKLRMHPFYAEKVARQAEGFSQDELREATVRLAALDLALKGDSRLAPDLELQRTLIELSESSGPGRRSRAL